MRRTGGLYYRIEKCRSVGGRGSQIDNFTGNPCPFLGSLKERIVILGKRQWHRLTFDLPTEVWCSGSSAQVFAV
jgi:hypothetical protein